MVTSSNSLLKPGEAFFCHEVIAVALKSLTRIVHLNEVRIVVSSLSGQNFPIVKADWVGMEMPFADHCGGVTGLAEKIGESGLESVKVGRIIIDKAV
jgi:hypothetical protein